MIKSAMVRWLLALACCAGLGGAAQASDDAQTTLRQSMQETLWPADIVRVSALYLSQYPRGEWADAARTLHERASASADVLARRDVRLFRSAFQPEWAPANLKADIRKAALGDQEAAVRLARHYQREGAVNAAQAGSRYVGWLQFAAMLGHEKAAYELALHFRQQDQPALASQYEARAVALGYTPPRDLDHVRK